MDASWQDRYGQRADSYRLPKGEPKRGAFAVQVGGDGFTLLEAVHHLDAPAWLRQLSAVQVLRRAWIQQYQRDGVGCEGVCWRETGDVPLRIPPLSGSARPPGIWSWTSRTPEPASTT